ncbi:Glutamine--tRNA ligase, cytoplasmic [Vitis vinifera]|uniref:Glutamine--tRNA ligase, cytoplasmic n=1 Tax=Vitis vinifera TaxID=29760 RepID=A0A438IF37_VITVI|nr:Glutamine--tRNA ligase, cytoplasmic [Vitis vinifera]
MSVSTLVVVSASSSCLLVAGTLKCAANVLGTHGLALARLCPTLQVLREHCAASKPHLGAISFDHTRRCTLVCQATSLHKAFCPCATVKRGDCSVPRAIVAMAYIPPLVMNSMFVLCGYVRFDDTNPEAEKKEYIDHIEEIVQWMGWEPFKITYTSDYFQDLYDLAVELIRRGQAYVDHQTPEEIKEYREKKMNSPWRDRPIEESLKLFDEMRRGMIEEGKATLRMKQDMQSDNFNMYDLIAYRIKASLYS